MDKYEFKATNLIAEKLEKDDITYWVVKKHGWEAVCVGFSINNGPNLSSALMIPILLRFTSSLSRVSSRKSVCV